MPTMLIPSTVKSVDTEGADLDAVISLYKRNNRTLGFLPIGAFEEFAQRGWVLVATSSLGLDGYLIWREAYGEAVIVHLCVAKERQGHGIASALLKELINRTRDQRAIRLSCREEYKANKVWPRHGFICDREKPGRGADGARLLIWTRKQAGGEPPLLAYIKASARQGRQVAAVDANVFFDFFEDRALSEESQSLLADWLQPELLIAITAELANEVTRQPDNARRDLVRARMTGYQVLEGKVEDVDAALDRLSSVLPPPATESDASDRRQLAHAVVEKADYFVSRDRDLLDYADALLGVIDVRVLRPADLIVYLHERADQQAYMPSRLAGTVIKERRPVSEAELMPFIRFAKGETKAAWLPIVRMVLADPRRYESLLVEPPAEGPKQVVCVDTATSDALTVVILRSLSHRLAETLLRRRLSELLLEAVKRGLPAVRVVDSGDSLVDGALVSLGFRPTPHGFVKGSVRDLLPIDEVVDVLTSMYPDDESISDASPADLESRYWPLKVLGGDVSTYIIPIQPCWASDLFDAGLAASKLFGADPTVALALENVYYSASPITIPAGSRILWYVSGKGRDKVQEVRASSICLETVIGPPAALFRRFRRLGIYRFRDVLAAAHNDHSRQVRGYRFALTERFPSPIPWRRLQTILVHHLGHGNQIASPVKVPETVFTDIYTEGTEVVSEHAAVLISIKPEFVAAIAAGTKTVELRKRFPHVKTGMSLVIYATQPVGAIVGIARIDRVEQATPETLWKQHRHVVGIEQGLFDRYFDGCETGHAVHLSAYTPVQPLDLKAMASISPGLRPPQSFRYLSPRLLKAIAEQWDR